MISLRMTTAAGCLGVTLFLACTAQCDDASPSPRVDSIRPVAVHVRGDLDRARAVFSRGGTDSRPGRVAFIGGSITEMEGYRPMVMADLQSRFPEAQFEFINAGIASTCSHTGAFRLQRDVLAMTPDLLLIEFAVNDDQDAAHSYQDALRGMEGIVRNAKTQLPNLDIVITHFVNQSMLKLVQQGKVPTSIRAHEAVAKHYGISTCNVAIELANQIDRGQTTWKIYGGVHPKPAGNRIAADLISDVFDAVDFSAREALAQPPSQKVGSNGTSTALPPPLDAKSFAGGRFLARDAISLEAGWSYSEPNWSEIPGAFRSRFGGRPLTVSVTPGAELTAEFFGSAVGLYVLAGPDAGTVEYSIDGAPWQSTDLFHLHSKGLHYPRTVVLASDLDDSPHEIKLRVSKSSHDDSKGTAIRILEFVAS